MKKKTHSIMRICLGKREQVGEDHLLLGLVSKSWLRLRKRKHS
jgi:hypothetical protein